MWNSVSIIQLGLVAFLQEVLSRILHKQKILSHREAEGQKDT